jgi:phospholipid-binding lipoprotein MlaA
MPGGYLAHHVGLDLQKNNARFTWGKGLPMDRSDSQAAGVRPVRKITALVAIALSALVGCASNPDREDEDNNDPFEAINRPIFGFNRTLDKYLLRPVAKGYDTIAPKGVKHGVTNFFWNLEQPVYVFNHVLQGKFLGALRQTGRFAINTTLGVAGLIDAAKDAGLPREQEDFGQTLGVWGWKTGGPYLMLPILGPSNPRDGIGILVDLEVDILYQYHDSSRRDKLLVLKAIDIRRRLLPTDTAVNEAPDAYIFVREAYLDNRRFKIYDGDPPQDDLDDFEAEFDAEFEEEFE